MKFVGWGVLGGGGVCVLGVFFLHVQNFNSDVTFFS